MNEVEMLLAHRLRPAIDAQRSSLSQTGARFHASRAMACAAGIAAVLSLSAPAAAQAAKLLSDQGQKACTKGYPERGRRLLESALKLEAKPGVKYHLATCYEKLGKFDDARRLFGEAAADASKDGRPDLAQLAQWAREEIDRLADRHPPTMRLLVVPEAAVRLPATTFQIDEQAIGPLQSRTPTWPLPGKHKLRLTAPGYETWEREVVVSGSPTLDIVVELTPAKELPAPNITPKGEVVAKAPPSPLMPLQGRRWEEPTAKTPPSWSMPSQRVVALLVGGFGALGLVAGTVTGVMALDKDREWKRRTAVENCDADFRCKPPDSGVIRSIETDRETLANAANVSFAAGGIALASSVVLWVSVPPRRPSTSRTLECVPFAAKGLVGAAVRGSF